jgi:hypothetical protein
LEKAEIGYVIIAGFLRDLENPDQKSEIAKKLAELRARLDSEQHCLNATVVHKGLTGEMDCEGQRWHGCPIEPTLLAATMPRPRESVSG